MVYKICLCEMRCGHIQLLQYLALERTLVSKNLLVRPAGALADGKVAAHTISVLLPGGRGKGLGGPCLPTGFPVKKGLGCTNNSRSL